MKRTQRKDALRNIWKQKVSYLSIAVIAMLGVTMFLAMNYGAAAISANGSAFYNDANFRDIEIVSTRLLSPEDMDVLGAIEGVQDVEGVVMTQGKVASGLIRKDVNVTTCSDRINRPVLLEGKLPASAEACVVERDLAEEMGWQLGDRIEIADAGGQQARFLTGKEYVIEGIVIHPDHVCGSVPDTPYILVSPEAFGLDIFAGCFMKAELILDVPKDKGRFDDPYTAAVKQIRTQIDAVGQERAPIRQAEVDAQLTQVAEERLISGWDVLEEAKEEIRRAIRNKLAEVLGEEAVNSIEWITKWTVNPWDEYADAMSFYITEGVKIDLNLSLRENVEKLVSSLALQDEILKSAFMLLNGEGEYSREAATALLVDKVMPGLDKYEDKYAELTQGCSAWNDTHAKFLDGTLWEEIGLPGICRWIVTDVSGNMSYVQLNSSRESLTRLQMTFSLLFIAVSALVIYATVSKMIDEQRNLVGATKALGFYRREIFAKYLTFGVSGTLLGTLMGVLIARFGVEPFILNGYQIYYSIDITRGTLTVGPTLIVFVAGLLLSVSAVWFACRRLLKTPAVTLLQTAMPKGRKTAAKGSSSLPLYSRLILRNIRSDLKRVIVTVVSVAGCCALVVVGFTLRHSVSGALERQFTRIVQYDGLFRFDPAVNAEAADVLDEKLKEAKVGSCFILNTYCTVQVRNLDVEELYCGDLDAMGRMFRLYDAKTGQPMPPSNEGVYIPKRFSEYYGVQPGDVLELTINATETVQAPVAGVFDNFMNRVFFMSEDCFEALFQREPVHNAALVRLNGASADALNEAFNDVPGYSGYSAADAFRQLFQSATSVMNAVVLLFIFMAAVMAGVVLMNLTNIYILQKKRELTVMRINGFTTKETIAYVTRETIATTALGIVLGIGLGALLGYAIVRALEPPLIQFDRSVSVIAWLIGVGMTVFFTAVVNAVALRKVKHLKLTDVA